MGSEVSPRFFFFFAGAVVELMAWMKVLVVRGELLRNANKVDEQVWKVSFKKQGEQTKIKKLQQ